MPHTEDHIEEKKTDSVDNTGLQDDTSSTNNVDGIQAAALEGAGDNVLEVTRGSGLGNNFTGATTNYMDYADAQAFGLQANVDPNVLRGNTPAPTGFRPDPSGLDFLRPDYGLAMAQGRFGDAAGDSIYTPLQPKYFQRFGASEGDIVPSKEDPNMVFKARGPGKGGFDIGLVANYEGGELTSGYELPQEFTDFMNKPVDPNKTTIEKVQEAESQIAALPDVAPTNNITEVTGKLPPPPPGFQNDGEGGLEAEETITDTAEPVVTTPITDDATDTSVAEPRGLQEPSPGEPVEDKDMVTEDDESRRTRVQNLVNNGMPREEAEKLIDNSIRRASGERLTTKEQLMRNGLSAEEADNVIARSNQTLQIDTKKSETNLADENRFEIASQLADKAVVEKSARDKALGRMSPKQLANRVNDQLIKYINRAQTAPATDLQSKRYGEVSIAIRDALQEAEVSLGDFDKQELGMLNNIFKRYNSAKFNSGRQEVLDQIPLLIERNRSRVGIEVANTQRLKDEKENLDASSQLTMSQYSNLEQKIASGEVVDDESMQKYFDESKRRMFISNTMSKDEQGKAILNATRFLDAINSSILPQIKDAQARLKDNPADQRIQKEISDLQGKINRFVNYVQSVYAGTTYEGIFNDPDALQNFTNQMRGQGLLNTKSVPTLEVTGGDDAALPTTPKDNILDLSGIPNLEGMETIFTNISNQSQTTARPVEGGKIQNKKDNIPISYDSMVANLIAIGTGNDNAVNASPYFSEKETGNADALAVVKKSSKRKETDTFENLYKRVMRGDFTQGSTSQQEQQFTNTYVLTIFDQLKRLQPSFVTLGPGIERDNSKAQTELNYILGGSYKWGSEKFNKRIAELKSKLK